MNREMMLNGNKVVLRSIESDDGSQIVHWRNDPKDRKYYMSSEILTLEKHMDWFINNYLPDDNRYDFIIIDRESNLPVGTAGMKHYGTYPEVSYAISEKSARGKGLAKDAINTLLKFARERMNAKKVDAVIHVKNIASICLVEGLGFVYAEKYEGNKDFLVYRKEL